MDDLLDPEAQLRLDEYFSRIGVILGNEERRASFAIYAQGLFGDAERKSVEPIAARACADPANTDAMHQRLLHFLNGSRWSDRDVRFAAARYAIDAITEREPIDTWIIDDTGFLKQGKHSVGVQRQYTGSAGKITNCQVGVSLSLASCNEHVPIDFELYLPRSWTDDPARCKEANIPAQVAFRTKPELALEMIRRAVDDGHPQGLVLADSGYGDSSDFRAELRKLDLHYAVAVDATTKVYQLNNHSMPSGDPISVHDLAIHLADQKKKFYQRCTWRQGTQRPLSARFCLRRVVPYHSDGHSPYRRERLWLVCEWEDSEPQPTKYYFVSLPSASSTRKFIRLLKQRWRTERVYQDLKGELGFDHFEGRRYPGWHHHISVALCCFAFIAAERVRRFPPSAARSLADHTLGLTPRASLPGFLHHDAPRHCSHNRDLASSLPPVSQT